MGRDRTGWIKPVDLPSQQVGVLKGILASCLQGGLRDLQRADRLSDPSMAQREAAALGRLLDGLERDEIAGPDEDACDALRRLAEAADEANNYEAVVLEHDALHGLLRQLEGKTR